MRENRFQSVFIQRTALARIANIMWDQIEALSDDPTVLQQQLQDMAGPGAVIRIDGFEGGALPAKAMIRSICAVSIRLRICVASVR